MFGIALRSLLLDRGKLVAALLGVAFATALLLVEIGLYVGLVDGASALVRRVGGDVWLMARGTEVIDNADTLPAGSDARLRADPCVVGVRSLIVATVPVRKPSGAIDFVQVVGTELDVSPPIPWSLTQGRIGDLAAPLAVAIDEHDVEKLQLAAAIGATFEISGARVHVVAMTTGIRAFSLNPYVFTDLANARRLAKLGDGEVHYWVAKARDASCVRDLLSAFPRGAAVEARTTRDLASMTERYWVQGSGAGAALAFSALFSLAVGAIIVGQTLYAITKEHIRELATLRAMGGTRGEIVAFIAWQAATFAFIGGGGGAAIAFALRAGLSRGGIEVALTAVVLGTGAAAVAVMCAVATVPSALRALRVGPAEILR